MSDSSSNTEHTTQPLVSHMLFGRRKIYTSVDAVTSDNVIDVVEKAYQVHIENREEIKYLYNYYKGRQPILDRVKEYRANITANLPINRAYEIVSFKVGYQCGNAMQYTASKSEDGLSEKIDLLNKLMSYEDKAKKDKDLITWQMICGTAYRIVIPDKVVNEEEDEAPFSVSTLRPADTFVIYSDKIGEKPMAAVTYWEDIEFTGELDTHTLAGNVFAVYTPDAYYEIRAMPLLFLVTIRYLRLTL